MDSSLLHRFFVRHRIYRSAPSHLTREERVNEEENLDIPGVSAAGYRSN